MPVGGDALGIVGDWIDELAREHLWGPSNPLFPAPQMGLDGAGGFATTGLSHNRWTTTQPVRDVFQRAFGGAGSP